MLWEWRPRGAAQRRGHGKGPHTAAPTPASTSSLDASSDLCPHPSCFSCSHACALLWAQPRAHNGSCSHLLWTYNVQQLCLYLTSTSFDLHKQAKVQRGEATSSRSQQLESARGEIQTHVCWTPGRVSSQFFPKICWKP